jgi:hypothetical protein
VLGEGAACLSIKNRIAEKPPSLESEKLPLLMSEKDASKHLGVSLSFLRKARSEGAHHNRTEAPPFIALGGRVYYATEDLCFWVKNLSRRTVI